MGGEKPRSICLIFRISNFGIRTGERGLGADPWCARVGQNRLGWACIRNVRIFFPLSSHNLPNFNSINFFPQQHHHRHHANKVCIDLLYFTSAISIKHNSPLPEMMTRRHLALVRWHLSGGPRQWWKTTATLTTLSDHSHYTIYFPHIASSIRCFDVQTLTKEARLLGYQRSAAFDVLDSTVSGEFLILFCINYQSNKIKISLKKERMFQKFHASSAAI